MRKARPFIGSVGATKYQPTDPERLMSDARYGLNLRRGDGSDRLEMRCKHQNGLLYMVPAEQSWVCEDEDRHAHVLAGFFKDLAAMDLPGVRQAMNRWGLYYRERDLDQ